MYKLYLLQAVFLFEGVLLAALAYPMMMRRVRPNGWYGFRTPRTLASKTVWYSANAYCGALLFISGLLTLAAAAGLSLYPGIEADVYGLSVGAVMGITIVLSVILSFVHLGTLKD